MSDNISEAAAHSPIKIACVIAIMILSGAFVTIATKLMMNQKVILYDEEEAKDP